ncbi:MAG: hypothetical protein IT561_00730 [Alphaproteobacteria bacterium]|nr:hypothetical protein [Alphaproteobacteria bacterium]
MTLATPKPGLVIHYSYLWWQEHRDGREEGSKDRPCAVVLTTEEDEGGVRVTVVPITHMPPALPDDGIEIPRSVKERLGLDHERSWIVVTEVNRFLWPGPDLRPVPRSAPARFEHGYLPPRLYEALRVRIIERLRRAVPRE